MTIMTTRSTRRRVAAVGIAVGLAVAVLFLLALRGDRRPTRAPGAAAPAPRSAAVRPLSTTFASHVPEGDLQQFSVEAVRNTKALYVEGSVFPPWSRPATPAWNSFIHWNAPRERTDDTVAEDPKGREVRAALVLDRLYARPGEPIVATLTLWRGDRDDPQEQISFGAAADVQVYDETTYDAEKWNPKARMPGYTSVWRNGFEAVPGKLNTGRVRFVPSEIPALEEQVSARFLATVKVKSKGGGWTEKPLELDFNYAIEEPVVVVAKLGDRVDEDGALRVDFEVDIRQAVPIKVESTLFDETGETAIAVFQDFWRPTTTGRQTFSVRFFGRAIAERGVPGPYTLSVHGFALRFDREPAELHWRDDRVFATAPYRPDDFSMGEWQDPTKDDMLRTYDQLEADLAAGRL
jgi:hypothetical protein